MTIGILCMILAGAAWTDALEGKVRNRWLLAGAAAGIWCRGPEFFPAAILVLILTFFLFRQGMMGAGDGKLMAVIAGYLGMDSGTEAIFTGMLIGAIWSLYRLWHSKSLKTRLIYLTCYFTGMIQTGNMRKYEKKNAAESAGTIPLAVCMAAGTYLYLLVSGAAAVWMKK